MKQNNEIAAGTIVPDANRNYKDTVFRMLFSEPENLLSLYNALNGTAYKDPSDLRIVTLDNAIYMGMKNDLAFIVSAELNLYEHQSTYNPNMPLRDLYYVSSEYQKLTNNDTLYSRKQIKLPKPKFVVFYNGTEDMSETFVQKLSEAFLPTDDDEETLELVVRAYNVNRGMNKVLMEQCRILEEYSIFISKVRSYSKDHELKDAVETAVAECTREGVLKEFLERNRAEVIMTSIFEYNKEEEEKKIRKAEYTLGYDEGIATGEAKGVAKGMTKGMTKSLVLILNSKWSVPEEVISKVSGETDEATIEKWMTLAAIAPDLDTFVAGIS